MRQRTTTMEATASNQRRLGVLLSFVLGMPVLALPPVNRQLERWGWEAARNLGIGSPSPDGSSASRDVSVTAAQEDRGEQEAAEMGRIVQNLQSLGAIYWQLEQLPADPSAPGKERSASYRFIAGVTSKSSSSVPSTPPRRFAAQSPDALSAMRAVEREVARWRRSPGIGE
ncbi:MAG: hypothetical protein ACKOU6_01395 [Planctomycetota bacterium]